MVTLHHVDRCPEYYLQESLDTIDLRALLVTLLTLVKVRGGFGVESKRRKKLPFLYQ